jgi:hypothetical protein
MKIIVKFLFSLIRQNVLRSKHKVLSKYFFKKDRSGNIFHILI